MLTALLFGCGNEGHPPERPQGVPSEAVWAGGLDGGSFVLCQIDLTRKVNTCTVYNDFSGQVVEHGDFRLKGEDRAARLEELNYSWADGGGMIGLKGGRTLVRVYLADK